MRNLINALIPLIFIMFLASCQKGDEKKTGEILFYSNIQALLNCGPFDIEIFIDDEYVGKISEPYVELEEPTCIASSSTLVVQKVLGNYRYSARISCGQYGYWEQEIELQEDSCKHIFLNIEDLNISD